MPFTYIGRLNNVPLNDLYSPLVLLGIYQLIVHLSEKIKLVKR